MLVGCKDNSTSHALKLSVDAVIQKTDSIAIYYTTNNSVEFYSEASYWVKVKGSKKNQTINFDISLLDKIELIKLGWKTIKSNIRI